MTERTIQGIPEGVAAPTADLVLIAATVAVGVALALAATVASALSFQHFADDRAVCGQHHAPFLTLALH